MIRSPDDSPFKDILVSTAAWITVIGACLGYILGTTGIVSQIITWRKLKDIENRKVGVAKITGDVEIAKVQGDVIVSEREHTGRFQAQLLDRLESLERTRTSDGNRISELEEHNSTLLDKLENIATLHGILLAEHETLKGDHEQLKRHVSTLEADNRTMRAKLELVG